MYYNGIAYGNNIYFFGVLWFYYLLQVSMNEKIHAMM